MTTTQSLNVFVCFWCVRPMQILTHRKVQTWSVENLKNGKLTFGNRFGGVQTFFHRLLVPHDTRKLLERSRRVRVLEL